MAFEQWHRYVFASITKHLLDLAAADSIECVVEFANARTPTWETAASNVEATIDGPRTRRLSKSAYRIEADVFCIVSSILDNGYEHIEVVGKVADWLNQCITVLDYGDTNSITIGILKPNNGDTGIVPINLKPARTDDRYHSTIQGSFMSRFNE